MNACCMLLVVRLVQDPQTFSIRPKCDMYFHNMTLLMVRGDCDSQIIYRFILSCSREHTIVAVPTGNCEHHCSTAYVYGQRMVNPPSILISAPLMLHARSLTSMLTACATSSGSASVPVGTNLRYLCKIVSICYNACSQKAM